MKTGWQDTTFGDIFEISSSKRVLQKQWKTTGVPFYRAREIVKLARVGSVANELFISEDLFREFDKKYGVPKPGDLMVSAVGTLGACYVVKSEDRFYYKDASVIQFSAKQPIHPPFFQHAFRTNQILDQIHSGSGSTVGTYTISRAKETKIPLPSLAEQKRIAAILDAADALRTMRREALAQLDALLQSSFLTLFGDPVENPMGWPRKSLGDLAREKPNNGIFRKNPDYVQEGKSGLPVVWVEELFRGSTINTEESRRVIPEGTEIQKYGLKYGDVLFCRSSLKLDGIAFNNVYMGIDDEALFECHVIRISPDLTRVSPIYLNTLLRSPQMRAIAKSKSKTATMTTIDQKSLCSIEMPLPPLKLQQVFENQFATVEKLKTLHRAHLAELDSLFAVLQHRAFRGEL